MSGSEQMVRLLVFLKALQSSQRGIVLSRFAEEQGWNKRTLYRDIQKIQKAGFPLGSDHGRYWLMKGWAAPEGAGADAEELFALFTAKQMAASLRGTTFGRALERLWMKVSGRGPQATLLPAVAGALSIRQPTGVDYGPHAGTLELLDRAVATRRLVRLHYRRPGADETERVVEPGTLHWDPGEEAVYLIAWCRLREAVRVFAVHRILDAQMLEETFAHRSAIDRTSALRGAFRLWRTEHVETVKLRFTGAAAARVRERRWHVSQRWIDTTDGGELALEVAAAEELEPWLLGFAEDVVIVEPRWLAERIQRRHATAAGAAGAQMSAGKPRVARTRRKRPLRQRTLSSGDTPSAQSDSRVARVEASRRRRPTANRA